MNNSKGENCIPGLEAWTSWLECVGSFYHFTRWFCFLGGMSSIIQITSWSQQSNSNHVLVLSTLYIFSRSFLMGSFKLIDVYIADLSLRGSLGIVLIKFPKIWSKSGIKWSVWEGTQVSVSRAELLVGFLMFSKYQ